MEIRLEKQPEKYLASVDEPTHAKLHKALENIKNLEGNIVKLKGTDNLFRYKLEHYRIIFCYDGKQIIIVKAINTRTNIKYGRFQ